MPLHLYSVSHRERPLAEVAAAANSARCLEPRLAGQSAVAGLVMLSTCNRVEIYLDASDDLPEPVDPELASWAHAEGDEALRHLFAVASGLDSMVLGEREIMGQVRRALTRATQRGQVSPLLGQCFAAALSTARKVSRIAGLESFGRSVVGVALDMASARVELDGATVLLIGTGSYAGATVAALRERGAATIVSCSMSDRGPGFAARHGLSCIGAEGLFDAMCDADLVVACRGHQPVLTAGEVRACLDKRGRGLTLVDLALARDIEPEAGSLPGVALIDLEKVRAAVPGLERDQLMLAAAAVDEGVDALRSRLRARQADPMVLRLRTRFAEAVADEAARLPAEGEISVDQARRALQRLANRIAHVPTVNAQQAARRGQADAWARALETVFGLAPEPAPEPARKEYVL